MKPGIFERHDVAVVFAIVLSLIAATVGTVFAVDGGLPSMSDTFKRSTPLTLRSPLAIDDAAAEPTVVTSTNSDEAALQASQALLQQAPTVIVADASLPTVVEQAVNAGNELKLPLLLVGDNVSHADVAAELDRLSVTKVVTAGSVDSFSGLKELVLPVTGGIPDDVADLASERDEPSPVIALVEEGWTDPAALVTVAASGAQQVTDVPLGDPRANPETIEMLRAATDQRTVGIGAGFVDSETLGRRVEIARTAQTLPGGGQVIFPHRMMVALYGTPGTPSLGLLGEQDLDGAVARAKQYAEDYAPLSDVPVIPAFEIITTVASSSAGEDGDYSYGVDTTVVKEWIERAGEEGIYVVLDLQPGRTDFLTQTKEYEELLKYPHVGLALDPEWRLKPNERHMRQIGSVSIAEVNTVHEYLTTLVRENKLPQKLLVLHQFKLSMLRDREGLETSNDAVSVLIHVDGNGPPGAKQQTWELIRKDAPEVFWGWKNFIDEDDPMLTPEQTMKVKPIPDLVTYQ